LKYFSMFSGIGGFDLALNRQGHQCVGYSEINEYSIKTYKKNFGEEVKNYGDATKINSDELTDFDLLCGGFPCQSFSIAGKRRGFEDTRGTLFFDIARIIEAKRPAYILLENVKGLLSHNKGQTFSIIINTISGLGYDVEWMVLNSGFYTQQNRQRVYIFGVFRGKDGGCGFSKLGFGREVDKRAIKTLPTISTKPMGRGECVIIEKENKRRWLTITECERLMGFPDDWTKGCSLTQRYKQCGNAVTVNVVEQIIQRMLNKEVKSGCGANDDGIPPKTKVLGILPNEL
jgi:site-specific DNA-cytosine methylase